MVNCASFGQSETEECAFCLVAGKGICRNYPHPYHLLRLHYRSFFAVRYRYWIELLRSHKAEFRAGAY